MRIAALAILLCTAPFAAANDFYVDPDHGSDAGNGSAAQPWRSLQAVFDDGLVETRDWPSYPYVPGMTLVTVNAGAPVRAGDTIWLRSGYHGDLVVADAYNSAPITIAAQPGQSPRIRSVLVRSAQNWILRDLVVSPSFAPTNEPLTMLSIENHGWTGPSWDVDVDHCTLYSVADASAWGANEWIDLASDGIYVGGDRVDVHDCSVRNVRFGIGVDGVDARIRRNVVDGFSADGLRGLGDGDVFEYNTIENDYIGDELDANHDDGFQSWSIGSDGQVGTGEVRDVVLRGSLFINAEDPGNPLRGTLQGIGCFDGLFVNWVVENNVVITDHWHGISFYGMRDSRIVNNTVIDLADGQPGPPFDLHLRAGAAAIDAGSSVLAPGRDIEGQPRPQGAGVDLGAYERPVDAIFRDGFDQA